MQRGVLLGFSGGIDSCTAARLLQAEGYRVVALTIDTIGDVAMMRKAEESARRLGVEWMSYDATTLFRHEVIDYFTREYAEGRTPAPCTRCNTHIKWHVLREVADSLGLEHIATGHYFNIEERDGRWYVAKGVDPQKDQSYYLWGLSQEVLRRAIVPMGKHIKSEVKLNFEDKSESMGVCFLQGMRYADFLVRKGGTMAEGDICTVDGHCVGRHSGIACYTIGQRRGEGIPEGMRVVEIEREGNRIIVGENAMLNKHKLYVEQCNIVSREELLSWSDITIKIRGIGRNPVLPVVVEPHGEGYMVTTEDAAWAPAKGQPLVFYRNNLVIGGGIVVGFE